MSYTCQAFKTPPVHSLIKWQKYSTKAAEVPFTVFKELFQYLVAQKNRRFRRQLAFPKELLLLDSNTITVGETRLP